MLILALAYGYWCFCIHYEINKKKNIATGLCRLTLTVTLKTIIFYFTLLPLVSLFTPTFVIQGAQILIVFLYLTLAYDKLTSNQKKVLGAIALAIASTIGVTIVDMIRKGM